MKKKKENNEKKDLNKDNNNIETKESFPSKEITDFISIIDQTSSSLPNFIKSLKSYFLYLETRISYIIQQINNSTNINLKSNINIILNEEINNIKDDLFLNIKQNNQLDKNIEIFDNYQKFVDDKNKELSNAINESIIKVIKKQLEEYRYEKIKIFSKFQCIINDILKLKKNIDLIENKDNEEFKIDNKSNDLQILQIYLSEFEKEYNLILIEIKELNKKMISFMSDNFNKYYELINKTNEEINKERIKIMNNIKKYKADEDNSFFEKMQKLNEVLSNDIKKFISLKNEGSNETKDKDKDKKSLLSFIGSAFLVDNDYYYFVDDYNISLGINSKDKDEDNYKKEDLLSLKNLINRLKQSEVVSDDSLNHAFNILGNNLDRKKYINLCLNFVKYVNPNCLSKKENNKNNNYFKYENFDNFIFANNLLYMISHNCKNIISSTDIKNDFKENYKIYQILNNIINIGDKSFIENKYMSSLLKESQFINEIKIWKACFKCELISTIKNTLNKKDKINNAQKVIYLFKNKTNTSSYQNFDFIKQLDLINYIESYEKLNNNEKNNFNNYELPKIVHDCMKKYIFHMANYNVLYEDVLNFIKEINEDFPFLKDEYWSFYLDYYKSSLYSIKKQSFESKIKNIKIKKKIKYIKQNKNNKENDNVNNNIINNEFKNNEQKKLILILKNSLIFLNNKEKKNLLCLNKNLKLFKYIYKSLLEVKEMSLEKHVKIWKMILKCSKLKNVNYKELCKNNDKVEYYKVILDDTKRTTLKNINKEKSNEIMKNILCCFALQNSSKIKYCQGMNFLAAFLYDLTNKEEDSFLLLTCLIDNTQLSKIYDHKFELLNCYFYILERLIFLFLPKISQKFKEVQLNIDCFASPYFITLFSNVYISSGSTEKINIFIIDNFIIKGWRVIFKSILSLLKYNEKEIIEKKDDEVVNYVLHDMKKSNIFLEENFEKFKELYKNYNIKDDLIENLQEEYNIENKIKKELNINIDL